MKFEDLVKFCLNGKLDISYKRVYKTSDMLLKVRLWVYSLAFAHLAFIATKLLTIDFTKADDPALWVYANVRWKLITCWFNLTSLVYLPVCIYCDWREIRREAEWTHVKQLNRIRNALFTSFLFPTTTFADILFWRLWNKDRMLVAPPGIEALVPFWTQHCMHTVTLVFTLLDLVLVPRKRPTSLLPGLSLMMVFLTAYMSVCADSLTKGEYLYPLFKTLNSFKLSILFMYVILEHLFYFTGQFFVYEFLWGRNKPTEKRLDSYS
ncbi:hypothetical protein ABMA27_002176 [Loxostege sticticalis]|uniref:Androgen-dependent TFPI-regulating protein n=1 Tax=Loxostege sticticalis TaxID=481309 RepID=A0ABR3HWW0_LOXSC